MNNKKDENNFQLILLGDCVEAVENIFYSLKIDIDLKN